MRGHPGCSRTRELTRAHAAPPAPGFLSLSRQRYNRFYAELEDSAAARDWNRDFPRMPVAMIHDRAEWRLLSDFRATQFHVVRDGREVASLDGWDGARSRAELVALLVEHELLAPEKRE